MEADGVTRFFLLEDVTMDEALSEVYPTPGPRLNRQERRETVDRADIIYTRGGIVWNRPSTLIIEDWVDTDTKTLEALRAAVELTLRKSGLTIILDRLSPEDMRYAGEDHDFGDGIE